MALRLTTILALALWLGQPARAEAPGGAVEGCNRLAALLYRAVSAKPGDCTLSPFSISSALAMAAGGARETTRTQMDQVLGCSVPSAFGQIPAIKGLAVANRVWVEKSYGLEEAFVGFTKGFGAPVAPLDFAGSPEGSRKEINQWVVERTEQMIKDLLPAGSITSLTRLVLVNALYFKARWVAQFEPKDSREEAFRLEPQGEVRVPLMRNLTERAYGENEDLQVCELDYANECCMDVLLPKAPRRLSDLEAKLTPDSLEGWLGLMEPGRKVQVLLPRFTTDVHLNLNAPLQALGMKAAFSPKEANFSGISKRNDLCVSDVFHAARVEVNEEGTKAAAATAVEMVLRGGSAFGPGPARFRADHPFLFLIRHRPTGLILFMGRLSRPGQV